MNVTIDLAKEHLQDRPENSDVIKADLIKVIAAYEVLEQQLKNCNLQNVNACTWKDKLEALIDGLEIENKEKLINDGDVETYKMLGEVMASRIKQLKLWR